MYVAPTPDPDTDNADMDWEKDNTDMDTNRSTDKDDWAKDILATLFAFDDWANQTTAHATAILAAIYALTF